MLPWPGAPDPGPGGLAWSPALFGSSFLFLLSIALPSVLSLFLFIVF